MMALDGLVRVDLFGSCLKDCECAAVQTWQGDEHAWWHLLVTHLVILASRLAAALLAAVNQDSGSFQP